MNDEPHGLLNISEVLDYILTHSHEDKDASGGR